MKTVVVIPAYNEAKVIANVIHEVRLNCPHVLVIDDGSADDTARVAREAGATVLRHALNRGQGAALQTGISAALEDGADIIVTYDADGQMRSEDIPAVVAPVAAGLCDVVLGSRFLNQNIESGISNLDSKFKIQNSNIPPLRRLTLKSALVFTKLTTGLNITDTHNGLRAFSRAAAKLLTLRCDRMAHASEILEQIAHLGLRYREVPVTVRYTDYSMQKGQKLSGAFRIIKDLIISSWTR